MYLLTFIFIKQHRRAPVLNGTPFFPEIVAQRPVWQLFPIVSVTSPRQNQATTPVLVQFWQIADMQPLCLASFTLNLQIQKVGRKNKTEICLSLDWIIPLYLFFAWSVPSTDKAGFTPWPLVMILAGPRNILEKALRSIIFHSLQIHFSTLDSSQMHYIRVYLKTVIDNQLSSCEDFKSSLHSFNAFLSLAKSYPWNSPAEDKSS